MTPSKVSTPTGTSVRVDRRFDAEVELVWRAYTDPDLLARWCLGPPGWSMPVCEMDVRVGGRYRWRWKNDEEAEFGFTGEFREVISQQKLVHTQVYDPGDLGDTMGENASIVTIEFSEQDGTTEVTTTIDFATQADRDAAMGTGMTDGMEMSYTQLDAVISGSKGA